MNIFITSSNPLECAIALDDLRLNKMILETAQLLCSAYPILFKNKSTSGLYKDTHYNHPCAVWTRTSIINYIWLYKHFEHLSYEKEYRTDKTHKSFLELEDKLGSPIQNELENLGDKGFPTPLFSFNCTENFTHIPNVHLAYRLRMLEKWQKDLKQPTWHNRGKPSWTESLKLPQKNL